MSSAANTTRPVRPMPSQPISVLDIFTPGLTHALTIAEQLLPGDIRYYTYVLFIVGVTMYLSRSIRTLVKRLEPYLTSKIHLRQTDEAYDMLLNWVVAHGITITARSSLVRIEKRARFGNTPRKSPKKALEYIPWNGRFWFWYKGRPISYRTELVELNPAGGLKEERICLTCFGRTSWLLKTLMAESREDYLNEARSKIAIFDHRGERWRKTGAKNIRPLSTVILSEEEKTPLLDDVSQFLEPETRQWYAQRSLPYRRGYLFTGPPGTGKSSLSFSLAGEFDLDIYIISIPDTTDRNLKDLFDLLPDRCMVLLEDIDAVGMPRVSQADQDSPDSEKSGIARRSSPVTLSGLLNTLDGVASQEGRVVMMTTNHADLIDPALIRPGRVDRRVEFKLADKAVIGQLFSYIYGPSGKGGEDDEKTKRDGQAAQFAESLPESTFSQAEIISYLLQYRDRPDEALKNYQAWVDTTLQRRGKSAKRSS